MKTFHLNWGGGYSKSEVDTLLNGKADTSHTHTKSDITDFPTIPTKTSELTNDSGFLTSHQDLSGYVPKAGGAVITGWLGKTTDSSNFAICGATSDTNGATMWLYGNDSPNYPGGVRIKLTDSNAGEHWFTLYPNGFAGWNGKVLAMKEDTVPRSGGAVMTGDLIARNVNNSDLIISGGTEWDQGGVIILRGKDYSNAEGFLSLGAKASDGTGCGVDLSPWGSFYPNTDNVVSCGMSGRRWTTVYSATSTINTSDSRLKNTITDIDDNLLDAWETIQPKQYKFNDATETKGDTARFHTGYIAQDIQKACTDNDIDISKYGLFCYDSWEEEPEITEDVEVEKDGVKTTEKRIIQSKKEKGDIYALRYEEALVVECAYLRREVSKLKQQNKNFEQRLKMLEQSVK